MGELESPDGCWWLQALAVPSPTLGWGLPLLACHQFSPSQGKVSGAEVHGLAQWGCRPLGKHVFSHGLGHVCE